jgi:hypothetical protein
MVNRKFIRCRNCDAVHHVTAFDKAPAYLFSALGPRESAANDWDDFMTRHAGHRLDPLEATGESFFPDGMSTDPMATGYIEATDGKETVLLRRVRVSIHEPLRYELIPGRLVQRESTLDIQENTLRKEMKLHFLWAPAQPFSDEKIDLFVKIYREVVRELDAHTICDRPFAVTDDFISYGPMNAPARDALLEKCQYCFTTDELAALRRFIDSHGEADDVLAIVVRRAMAIEPRM